MPHCKFLFSAVFVFHQSRSRNILGIGRNEARSPYFFVTYTESEGDSKGARGAATPGGGAPLVARPRGVGPLVAHRHRPSAYLFHSSGKPYRPEPPSTKSSVAAIIVNPSSGGFWSSSRHPAREEIITGGLYIAMPASGVMREIGRASCRERVCLYV